METALGNFARSSDGKSIRWNPVDKTKATDVKEKPYHKTEAYKRAKAEAEAEAKAEAEKAIKIIREMRLENPDLFGQPGVRAEGGSQEDGEHSTTGGHDETQPVPLRKEPKLDEKSGDGFNPDATQPVPPLGGSGDIPPHEPPSGNGGGGGGGDDGGKGDDPKPPDNRPGDEFGNKTQPEAIPPNFKEKLMTTMCDTANKWSKAAFVLALFTFLVCFALFYVKANKDEVDTVRKEVSVVSQKTDVVAKGLETTNATLSKVSGGLSDVVSSLESLTDKVQQSNQVASEADRKAQAALNRIALLKKQQAAAKAPVAKAPQKPATTSAPAKQQAAPQEHPGGCGVKVAGVLVREFYARPGHTCQGDREAFVALYKQKCEGKGGNIEGDRACARNLP